MWGFYAAGNPVTEREVLQVAGGTHRVSLQAVERAGHIQTGTASPTAHQVMGVRPTQSASPAPASVHTQLALGADARD